VGSEENYGIPIIFRRCPADVRRVTLADKVGAVLFGYQRRTSPWVAIIAARICGTVLQDERYRLRAVDFPPSCLCQWLKQSAAEPVHAPDQTEPLMRKYSYPLVAIIVLGFLMVEASAQSMRYSLSETRETPQENVRKSQWYDYLLSINARFRTYRTHKECSPINYSLELRQDCVGSFDTYEPIRPGYH
jgi:hypothetical protein